MAMRDLVVCPAVHSYGKQLARYTANRYASSFRHSEIQAAGGVGNGCSL